MRLKMKDGRQMTDKRCWNTKDTGLRTGGDGRYEIEDERWKTEDRRQTTDNRWWMTMDQGLGTEDDVRWKTEDKRQKHQTTVMKPL